MNCQITREVLENLLRKESSISLERRVQALVSLSLSPGQTLGNKIIIEFTDVIIPPTISSLKIDGPLKGKKLIMTYEGLGYVGYIRILDGKKAVYEDLFEEDSSYLMDWVNKNSLSYTLVPGIYEVDCTTSSEELCPLSEIY